MRQTKYLLGLLFTLLSTQTLLGQMGEFSKDGEYYFVSIDKSLYQNKKTLVLQNSKGSWSKQILNCDYGKFSADSKKLYYQSKGFLYIMQLGTSIIDSIPGIASFTLCPSSNNNELLVYQTALSPSKMVILYQDNSMKEFDGIVEYRYLPGNDIFYVQTRKGLFNGLGYIDKSGNLKEFWSDTAKIVNWLESVDNASMVFMIKHRKSGNEWHELLHYEFESKHIRKLFSDTMKTVKNALIISSEPSIDRFNILDKLNGVVSQQRPPFTFIDNGNSILIYMMEKQKMQLGPGPEKDVDVWSYFDPVFQTAQKASVEWGRNFAHAINLRTGKIIRLENDGEIIFVNKDQSTRYFILYKYMPNVLVKNQPKPSGNGAFVDIHRTTREFNWNCALQPDVFLVAVQDGSRQLLRKQVRPFAGDLPFFWLSPNGKYVVQFHGGDRHYYSYEVLTGKWRRISQDINTPLERGATIQNHDVAEFYFPPSGLLMFFEEKESHILIRDTYSDIWRVNLNGDRRPENLTDGFAKRNNVRLFFAFPNEKLSKTRGDSIWYFQISWSEIVRKNRHKTPGYYALNLNTGKFKTLIKEKEVNLYSTLSRSGSKMLLKKEYLDRPEEYIYSKDFQEIRVVSSSLPDERVGHAVKKEFISWKTFDGLDCYGMLYTPDNFDSTKKYPLIVNYYELQNFNRHFEWQKREGLNNYAPVANSAFYLQNGYLVFVPEIYQEKIGQTCYNAYNCVVSGAKELLKKKYIDASKIGITGHSFGGYETNCLITQTNIFAAAIAGAGYSDMISSYLGDIPYESHFRDGAGVAEVGQNRMGSTPWKNLDVYIANSPVLHADKVTTPLLLLHSKDDSNVPYLQSVEMFKALRRMGKKVWLVSGDSGGHSGPRSRAIFMLQFFDHYLKGKAPGKWMTQGLPAHQKGLVDPFELDTNISTPPPPTIYDKEAVIPIMVKDKVRKQ